MNLENTWDWFAIVVRSVGASFKGAASLAHFQGELDMRAFGERLKRFEDPISQLHEDIPRVSERIYDAVREANGNPFQLDPPTYADFKRPLAILESNGFIRGHHALGTRYAAGIGISDPEYVFYLCSHFEDKLKMKHLISAVDSCAAGKTLRTDDLTADHGVPRLVVDAVLQSFANKGFGILSTKISGDQSYSAIT